MKSTTAFFVFAVALVVLLLAEPVHCSKFKRMGRMDEDMLILSVFVLCLAQSKVMKRPKRYWIKKYYMKRKESGRFAKDYHDLRHDSELFKENFHVTIEQFDYLLSLVKFKLSPRKKARKGQSISAEEKLCMTLEFLASGSLQRHIANVYRSSKQNFGPVIENSCWVIYGELIQTCLPKLSEKYWTEASNKFHRRWNFPNCVGAVDGKHVKLEKLQNKGSIYFNYKESHSIHLMAVCDADYKFVWLDCGTPGSNSDSTIFHKSDFGKALFANQLGIPSERPIAGLDVPLFVVADDAFPLHDNIMKPYVPKKGGSLTSEELIFNYRLSRARRCIENTFGILCVRWLCLKRTLLLKPSRAKAVVLACCLLHNFLMKTSNDYCPQGFADSYDEHGDLELGVWRSNLPNESLYNSKIPRASKTNVSGRPSNYSKRIRDHLKSYVNSTAGSLPWQKKKVYLE